MKTNSRWVAGLVFVAVSAAAPALAQRSSFNPWIALSFEHTDNLDFGGSPQEISDSATRLSAGLPYDRDGRTNTLRLRYILSFVKQDAATDLDRTEHRGQLDYNADPNPRTSWFIVSNFSRSQEQGLARISDQEGIDDSDLTLTARTTRETTNLGIGVRREVTELWSLGLSGNWAAWNNKPIDGVPDQPDNPVEDRISYGLTFDVSRELSLTSTLGLYLRVAYFDLDLNPNETASALNLRYTKEVTRKLSYTVSAGVARTELDEEPLPGQDIDPDRTSFFGRFSLNRDYRKVSLRAHLYHRPSAGNNLAGTSTDTNVGLELRGRDTEHWDWLVSTRYVYRDPSDRNRETTETVALGTYVQRTFMRVLGLRLGGNLVSQTETIDEYSNASARISLIWYPVGRSKLARGVF